MRILSVPLILLLACGPAFAQTSPPTASATAAAATAAPAPASSITTLQAINVTGVVPGPGLWKVGHGEHVLWVLGVVPTVPDGIRWQPAEVERAIAGSQAMIAAPDVKLKVDASWFGKLFLLLPVRNAQRNPDGKTLAEVLPPALYARWQVQKQRYFGDDRGIERYRPIVAGSKLLKQALKANGLRSSGKVEDAILALAQQHAVKVVNPDTTLEIHHPHDAVKAFAKQGPDGRACFEEVLDAVEHQIPTIRARANAWATGDIEALRKLPGNDYRKVCTSALMNTGFARQIGIDNLPQQVENRWLDAAESALVSNTQSFAVLPMQEVLDPRGYLAALQARGYTVTAPDAAIDPDEAGDAVPAAADVVPGGRTRPVE